MQNTPPQTVQQNIEAIARLEQEFLETRTQQERVGDAIASFAGSMSFVLLHLAWFAIWIVINAKWIPGIPAFDPYPFIFLSMMVSLEAVLLSTFVLMKQNRMSRRSDERAQLDLQINLLSEKEATLNLQLLQKLCDHFGLHAEAQDEEVEELAQHTAIDTLADQLKQSMPIE